ncbi:MAG: YegS/Rv2252/BmrU family lipid kinase [Oscillospiraceae bacterium]|nr:YegS/Rv2252/BmrU family lipid kinase [Oscillospiraceae bacterium]
MKKLLFVFNPHSGKGQIRQHLMTITDIFTKGGYEVTVHPTQCKNDAYEKILSRGNDFDVVACSGGDGTLNETIKAVMTSGNRLPIGYIPSGTMNDFASAIGIPKDMPAAAQKIVESSFVTVDIGSFNQEYFTYIAAFGMFTEVSYETSQQMKNMFGSLAYIMEGMKRFNMTKTYRVKVTHDGETTEDEYIYGMVSNSSSVGGIKGFGADDILLDDGVFEVFLIKAPKNLQDFQFTINSLMKHELDAKCFTCFKAAEVTFHSDNDLPWTLDGEFGGDCRNVMIKNNHRAIDIFAEKNNLLSE